MSEQQTGEQPTEDTQETESWIEDVRERRRRKADERNYGRGCIVSSVALVGFLFLGLCSGIARWAGCRTGVLRNGETTEVGMSGFGAAGEEEGLGFTASETKLHGSSYSKHIFNQAGDLVASDAHGPGFNIAWRTTRTTGGASLETVLDSCLSRAQALQKSTAGSNELAKVIYQLDKTLEEIRQSGFNEPALVDSLGKPESSAGFQVPTEETTEGGGAGFSPPEGK